MKYFISILSVFLLLKVYSQDLEKISDAKWLTYSGNISVGQTYYQANGIENRRDPYFWQINANLNFNILGIVNLPFSLVLSQQNKQFNQPQPFNRVGLSPNYKAYTLHLGYRSLYFSDFTLAGNMFFGIGAEYKPDNIPIQLHMMYGRFTKPVSRFAQEGITVAHPAYKRMGYGVRLGYEKDQNSVFINILKSRDDPNSVEPDSLLVKPQENLVLGIEGALKLFERIHFQMEYAYSMHTRDISSSIPFLDTYSFNNNLGSLFKPNGTSNFSNAFNGSLNFSGDFFQLSLNYRRVDPEYTTHGSSFINNDLENVTIGFSIPFWKRKIHFNSQLGLQRNNLDEQLTTGTRRMAVSSGLTANISKRLNISLSHNNYSTNTIQSVLRPDLLTDTLEYFQVNGTSSANINFLPGNKMQHTVFAMLTNQITRDSDENETDFLTANAGASISLTPNSSLSLSGIYSTNTIASLVSVNTGPSCTFHQKFNNQKIRSAFSINHLRNYRNGRFLKHISTIRGNLSYAITDQQDATLIAFYTYQHTDTENRGSFSEMRISLHWRWRF